MSPNLPGGCKSTDEFAQYLVNKIKECVREYKSEEETVNHLWEIFKIDPAATRIGWDHFEKHRIMYDAYCENLRKIQKKLETEKMKEKTGEEVTAPAQATQADSSTQVEDSTKAIEPRPSPVFIDYVKTIVEDYIAQNKSKEETEKDIYFRFAITTEVTREAWDKLEKESPSLFSSYHTEQQRLFPPGVMHSKDPKVKEQQQQQRLFPPARPRLTEPAPNASSQQAAIAPNRVEQISSEANARKKQKTQHLQASQQPVSSSAMESVGILEQILTSMTKIATTSEEMLKLMTDAAKSREKQPVEKEQVRGDNEETENLQNQNQQLPQRMDMPKNQAGKDNTK